MDRGIIMNGVWLTSPVSPASLTSTSFRLIWEAKSRVGFELLHQSISMAQDYLHAVFEVRTLGPLHGVQSLCWILKTSSSPTMTYPGITLNVIYTSVDCRQIIL